jgi:ABC-type multidrug transport system ATPase subunit
MRAGFLSAHQVFFRYPGQTNWALDDVGFSLDRGCSAVIEGSAGSGKTTLLRTLTGHLCPQNGRFLCRSYPGALPARAFGVMPQAMTLVPGLSTLENTIMPFLALNRQIQERDIRFCNQLLQALDLGPFRHAEAGSLSHQQQRVLMFVRAFVHRPAIVVLDDPFGGVQASLQKRMIQMIQEFCHSGMTVVMTLGEGEADRAGLVDPVFWRYGMDHGHLESRFTEGFARSVA